MSHIQCNEVKFICQIINHQKFFSFFLLLGNKYMKILNPQTRTPAIWGRAQKSPTMICAMHTALKEPLSNHCSCHSSLTSYINPLTAAKMQRKEPAYFEHHSEPERGGDREPSFIISDKRQSVGKSDFQSFKGY